MRERIMNDECLLDDNNHHHHTSADDTDSVTERITKIEVHAAKHRFTCRFRTLYKEKNKNE